MNNELFLNITQQVIDEVEKVIIGKTDQIRILIMAILSEGHILLEDIPGVGKTTLIKTLSHVVGCSFKRIQFTPDLLPSDIVGVNTFNQKSGEFQFIPGPVMTNILMADEINRAIPRTQSALLECMEERQVTVDGTTLSVPSPFIVMATQNPIESEGTFPLPAAQMDRFMVRLSLGYPSKQEEGQILINLEDKTRLTNVKSILNHEVILSLQHEINSVYIDNNIVNYIVELVQATRNHPMIRVGASPRASRALYMGSKVWAAMHRRDFVTPDDVQDIAVPVMSHRILPKSEARLLKKSVEEILMDIIADISVPPGKEEILHAR